MDEFVKSNSAQAQEEGVISHSHKDLSKISSLLIKHNSLTPEEVSITFCKNSGMASATTGVERGNASIMYVRARQALFI